MLNAAIVGLGRWGRVLVDSVQAGGAPKGGHIRFSRGVARTVAKAADYAVGQKLKLGDDYAAVLADPKISAVVLATPHSQHRDQIVAAAAAGKHVFVEKPMTLTRADAKAAVAACEKAGVVLAVGHKRRFLPALHEMKRTIDRGGFGQILHIEGTYTIDLGLSFTPGMWRADPAESPAGGMTGLGIHTLDTMIWLCGPIAAVRATSIRQAAPTIDDTTFATLRFASGMTGILSTLTASPEFWRIQVFGTKGWAHMRDHETVDFRFAGGRAETRTYDAPDTERAELEAFAMAADGGVPFPVSDAEAVNGVAALEAIINSADRDGAEVATG